MEFDFLKDVTFDAELNEENFLKDVILLKQIEKEIAKLLKETGEAVEGQVEFAFKDETKRLFGVIILFAWVIVLYERIHKFREFGYASDALGPNTAVIETDAMMPGYGSIHASELFAEYINIIPSALWYDRTMYDDFVIYLGTQNRPLLLDLVTKLRPVYPTSPRHTFQDLENIYEKLLNMTYNHTPEPKPEPKPLTSIYPINARQFRILGKDILKREPRLEDYVGFTASMQSIINNRMKEARDYSISTSQAVTNAYKPWSFGETYYNKNIKRGQIERSFYYLQEQLTNERIRFFEAVLDAYPEKLLAAVVRQNTPELSVAAAKQARELTVDPYKLIKELHDRFSFILPNKLIQVRTTFVSRVIDVMAYVTILGFNYISGGPKKVYLGLLIPSAVQVTDFLPASTASAKEAIIKQMRDTNEYSKQTMDFMIYLSSMLTEDEILPAANIVQACIVFYGILESFVKNWGGKNASKRLRTLTAPMILVPIAWLGYRNANLDTYIIQYVKNGIMKLASDHGFTISNLELKITATSIGAFVFYMVTIGVYVIADVLDIPLYITTMNKKYYVDELPFYDRGSNFSFTVSYKQDPSKEIKFFTGQERKLYNDMLELHRYGTKLTLLWFYERLIEVAPFIYIMRLQTLNIHGNQHNIDTERTNNEYCNKVRKQFIDEYNITKFLNTDSIKKENVYTYLTFLESDEKTVSYKSLFTSRKQSKSERLFSSGHALALYLLLEFLRTQQEQPNPTLKIDNAMSRLDYYTRSLTHDLWVTKVLRGLQNRYDGPKFIFRA